MSKIIDVRSEGNATPATPIEPGVPRIVRYHKLIIVSLLDILPNA